jgi:hypothetical protein
MIPPTVTFDVGRDVVGDVGGDVVADVGGDVVADVGVDVVVAAVGVEVGLADSTPGGTRTLSITCMIPLQASVFGMMILASFTLMPVPDTSMTTGFPLRVIRSPLMKSFL